MKSKYALIAVWFVVLLAGLWRLTATTAVFSARSYDLLSRPPLVRLDNRILKVITLGHYGLYEDILDIWGIQALMDHRLTQLPATDVQKLLIDITHQTPRLETFYMLACFTLDLSFHRADLCEPITMNGIRAIPTGWRVPMVQGYVEAYRMKNNQAASVYYGLAASRPGAPAYLQDLSKKLATTGAISSDELDQTLRTIFNGSGSGSGSGSSQLEQLLRERATTP